MCHLQVAFEFGNVVFGSIRREAKKTARALLIKSEKNRLAGYQAASPISPRLTVSLTEEGYQKLAQRYRLNVENKVVEVMIYTATDAEAVNAMSLLCALSYFSKSAYVTA